MLWEPLAIKNSWSQRGAGAREQPGTELPAFPGRQQRGGTGTDVRDAEQVSHCQPTQLDFRTLIPTRIKASADQVSADQVRFHLNCSHTPEYSAWIPGEQGMIVLHLDSYNVVTGY